MEEVTRSHQPLNRAVDGKIISHIIDKLREAIVSLVLWWNHILHFLYLTAYLDFDLLPSPWILLTKYKGERGTETRVFNPSCKVASSVVPSSHYSQF